MGIRNLMTTVKYPSATVERAISELERICRHYELDRVEVSTMGLRKFILDDNIWNGYISDKIFCQRLVCNADVKRKCFLHVWIQL